MGDREKLFSPLKRARMGVEQWIEMLPQDIRCHAESSLERLCEAALRDIEQAYYDGHNQRANSERIRQAVESAAVKAGEAIMSNAAELAKLPAIPDSDADFTPDLARKIIAKYQQILAAQQDAREDVLAELKRLHERNGWQSTADLIRRLEQRGS